MSKTKKQSKRKMRGRHSGRLELRGQTFIARWMVNSRRFSESTKIKIEDFNGDERKAREAAEDWLMRKLAALRAADAVKKIDRDEASIRAQQEVVFAGAFRQLDERRATATDEIPPLKVADAFDRLVKSPDYKTPKPQTIRNSRMRFDRFARWLERNHNAVVLMREVTPAVARQYAEDLKCELGAATYNVHLVTLNQMWSVLADEIKGDVANPWAKIRKQTAAPSYRRALTDAELAAIFKGAQGDGDLTLLFSIMLLTGARLSDAATMRWESIRFDRGVIDFTATKTGARCKPPLVPALRQLLEQTPITERTGFVVQKYAELYHSANGQQAMSAVVTEHFKRCGIETSIEVNGRKHPAATAHSFRHTFISKCGNSGVPLEIVKTWVGHVDTDMSAKYFHSDERITQLYAQQIPTLTAAPLALANAAGDAPAVECEIIQPSDTDTAEARYRRFCEAVDALDAADLDRAAAEIARRRSEMKIA